MSPSLAVLFGTITALHSPSRQILKRRAEVTLCVHYLHVTVLTTDFTGTTCPSNVVVEWLTLLLPIREVPGSNLGSDTGYLY
jgi:hypothetical protein